MQKDYIYYEEYFTKEFKRAFFNYIFGIMSINHLEANDADLEMFYIIFLSTSWEINGIPTSTILKYYKEDLRQLYYSYFKMRIITNTNEDDINKIISRMRDKIISCDLSPTDIDYENCMDMVLDEYAGDRKSMIRDIISYKPKYFKDSYYNMIRIIHNLKGYR